MTVEIKKQVEEKRHNFLKPKEMKTGVPERKNTDSGEWKDVKSLSYLFGRGYRIAIIRNTKESHFKT